jgi:hypothetical protein
MSPALAAAPIDPHQLRKPAPWTLIAPGWERPIGFAEISDVAERLACDAKGQPLTLTPITCVYPGFDTFSALKVEALDSQSGERSYVGVVASEPHAAEALLAAVAAYSR